MNDNTINEETNVSNTEEPIDNQETNEVPEEVKQEEEVKELTDLHLQEIENFREGFAKVYKRVKFLKYPILIVSVAMMIVAFLVVPNVLTGEDQKTLQITLMVVLAVLALLIMLSDTFITKSIFNKKLVKYFDVYYGNLDDYLYVQDGVEIVEARPNDKLEASQFTTGNAFGNVGQVISRGLVDLKLHDLNILACDASGQVAKEKRYVPVFVGKYLISPAKYSGSDVLIYLKGDERALPPTNTESMKLQLDEKRVAVYSNDSNWKKVFTTKFKTQLLKLKSNKTFVDLSINVRDGSAYFYLGLDDEAMTVPLEKPLVEGPYKRTKEALSIVYKLIELLNE